eukprot:scaffold7968_cov156-Skeletonema_menzelii.AAC.4
MAMIGEIDDDCEEMVGGAAAGSNALRVDWLERELLEVLVRPIVDSLQTWQSRVGQQQRCQRVFTGSVGGMSYTIYVLRAKSAKKAGW